MKNLFLIALALFTVVFTSCKKDEPPTPTPEPTTSNLGGLFTQNLNNAKQTFTFNASIYNEIVGQNGVKVLIPANSFKYANGSTVTGTITFELIEILDQASMILMNKPTTSNGQILVSGGQLKLTATQSGNPIYLKANASVTVMVPTSSPDFAMQLFDGTENGNGQVDWILSVDDSLGTPDSVIIVNDTTTTYYYFEFDDSTLGWINCDYFWNNPNPQTTVSVNLPDDHVYTNTAVYLHFSTINSVAFLYYNGTSFSISNIPEGVQATVVCISEISGTYYSAFIPITVTTNHIESPTMNVTTLADIQATIASL